MDHSLYVDKKTGLTFDLYHDDAGTLTEMRVTNAHHTDSVTLPVGALVRALRSANQRLVPIEES